MKRLGWVQACAVGVDRMVTQPPPPSKAWGEVHKHSWWQWCDSEDRQLSRAPGSAAALPLASEDAWGRSDWPTFAQGPTASSHSPTSDPPKAALHPCPALSPVVGPPQVAEGPPAPTWRPHPLL